MTVGFFRSNWNSRPRRTMYFRTVFSGLTAQSGTDVTESSDHKQYDQTLTGADNVTGYTMQDLPVISTCDFKVEYIAATATSGATKSDRFTDLASQIEVSTVLVPGYDGQTVTALRKHVKTRGATSVDPQCALMHQRTGTGYANYPDPLKESYVTAWHKFQTSGLNSIETQLDATDSNANWRVLREFKTGGFIDSGVTKWYGDFRIVLTVTETVANGLQWELIADNRANGLNLVTGVSGSYTQFWRYTNTTNDIPSNAWIKIETYIKRSQNYDDLSTGRAIVTITPASTMTPVVIFDVSGGRFTGYNDLPWNRIFYTNDYSGGALPIDSYITDLQLWDRPESF
jgi:hypothetical protein